MSAKFQQKYFLLLQLSILAAIAGILWLMLRPKRPESLFQVREADLKKPGGTRDRTGKDELAHAKLKRHEPLRLGGIRIDGPPHEVLGVKVGATPEEIQKSYRDLMKRYHPDLVGRPGSREWNDAQRIAEALNRAKETLLKRS